MEAREVMPNQNRGLLRFVEASKYSWMGMRAAYQNEEAFRQETWLAIILTPIAVIIADNGIAWVFER